MDFKGDKGFQSCYWNTHFLRQWAKFPLMGNMFSSHSETEKNYIKWEIFFSKVISLNTSIMQYLGNVIFNSDLKVIMKQTYKNLIAWHQIFQKWKNCLNHHIVSKSYFFTVLLFTMDFPVSQQILLTCPHCTMSCARLWG